MGLLKAGTGALGGVLADSWRDFFYCEALDANTLAAKGEKRTSDKKRSSNTKGESNIITDGSIVAVNDGQFMIIVDQGEVVEFCGEPGEFVYDRSTEPTLYAGDFGEQVGKTFERIGHRFGFGGDTGHDQRIYYFNTKEIIGNKYGTSSPVPFRVVDANIGLDIDISVRCNGEYSYKLIDPLLFYTNVCGNIEDVYTRDNIDSQLKSELLTALQPAFAKISAMGVRYSAIPLHTQEMADALNEELSETWTELRGIEVASFGMNSITASEEDEQMIKELQKSAVLRDPNMAAASIAGAQSDAMRMAASNEAGAMAGFMGMGMTNAMGGMNAQNLYSQESGGTPQSQYPQAPGGGFAGAAAGAKKDGDNGEWTCPTCGATCTGKFCGECGTKRPEPEPPAPDEWTCPTCGAVNDGKFCGECGTKRPEPEPPAPATWTCPTCGAINDGKFCGECGTKRPEPEAPAPEPEPVDPTWTCECGEVNEGNFCGKCGKKRPE